jgi:hypothetical protein
MHSSSYLLGLCAASGLFAAACASDEPAVSRGNGNLSGDGDGTAGDGDKGGSCTAETEEDCSCPDGQPDGRRYCFEGHWLECSCLDDSEDAPLDLTGDCRPGRYEGDFWGYYNSSFTVVGVPIPVFALSATAAPGLAFTLNAVGEVVEPGAEFGGTLEISDGYVKGTADGLFPFEGKLTGKLDCKTKKFEATLKGGYCLIGCVGVGVNQADFEGPVVGYYNSDAHAFAKSTWKLVEKTPLMGVLIGFGGEGEWSATWKAAGSVDPNTGTNKP